MSNAGAMGEELPFPNTAKEHYRMKTIDRIVPTASYPSERALSRPHWSYSQLNGYLRCPLQYFFERGNKGGRESLFTQGDASFLVWTGFTVD